MSKITNVLIIDANTLRLETDAFKGDEIDLTLLNKVDTSTILKQIEIGKDNLYNQKINELKASLEKEKEVAINLALKEKELFYKEQLNKIKSDNEKVQLEFDNLKKNTDALIKVAEMTKEKQLNDELTRLKNEVESLKLKLNSQKELSIVELNNKLLEVEKKYSEELANKDKQLTNLKLEKSSLNVKKLGEELENWCNNEYLAYSQTGFATCSWTKDNTSVKDEDDIKGSKADYIFKVYATVDKQEKDLLASVACEMKNEDPNSTKKKKNSDYYKKLDADRRKKNCEYALLVSELEWDYSNDVPIRKVFEYEKMYVVRPQYFITFLSIVNSLGLKFKELLLEENKRIEQFRDQQEILDEFEKFKNTLLDKPILKLEKEVESIKKNAYEIIKLSNKIDESANEIVNKGIEQIKKQINNYNINKLVKKISKIN